MSDTADRYELWEFDTVKPGVGVMLTCGRSRQEAEEKSRRWFIERGLNPSLANVRIHIHPTEIKRVSD